ncbi:holdfast anchor protein HfaD [Brevundimonas kwangchunensis]|uniref:Holdfast anchor protein HfaD n=1 Tax=Brevundimonas kwangchunensis TaxID=322163 RepID=A0ABN1H6W9_9CAUL
MAPLARIRLAGTIAATAMCVAAATEAAAQSAPQDGTIVLNEQLQLGDVFSHQTINVVNATGQVTVNTSAQGNQASGAVQNDSIVVQSDQDMRGDAIARSDVTLGGDTGGPVNVVTQAGGNYLAASAYDSELGIEATQSNTGDIVSATSQIGTASARLLSGGSVAASAISNTTAVYGEGSVISGSIDQSNDAVVRSYSRIDSQYIPAEASVTAQTIANAIAVNSGQTSGQNLELNQNSTADFIEAESSANTGNGWNLAARARANANQAVLYNEGGSVVMGSNQSNSSYVRSAATTTAYDYGRVEAHASGAANTLSVGNNDIFVEIDNTQFNEGGVDVTSTFVGTNGYDIYVGAEAVGNQVTGYACSECAGYMDARNSQTNSGDVSARANTTVNGSSRAVITGANAVGNAATFYVSRSGN